MCPPAKRRLSNPSHVESEVENSLSWRDFRTDESNLEWHMKPYLVHICRIQLHMLWERRASLLLHQWKKQQGEWWRISWFKLSKASEESFRNPQTHRTPDYLHGVSSVGSSSCYNRRVKLRYGYLLGSTCRLPNAIFGVNRLAEITRVPWKNERK